MFYRILVVGLFFATLLRAADAYGCSCAEPTPSKCRLPSTDADIFVGTVLSANGGVYHLRVDEKLTIGMSQSEVDVYSFVCGYRFEVGEQYLIFPYHDQEGRLSVSMCSRTRLASSASATIAQLRAMREGAQVASVYGVLRREQEPPSGTYDADYDHPVGNVVVRLRFANKARITKTDALGAYYFYNVPAGNYQLEADLPRYLELGQTILNGPLPLLQLPAGACFENDLVALPTGKIRGRVLNPDGTLPPNGVSVELFRAEKYSTSERGWWEFQDDKKGYFEFAHVAPGDYVLVFNNSQTIDPDAPFQRTFYGDVADITRAAHIQVGEGEQVLDADIHLRDGKPTRLVTVHVSAKGLDPKTVYVAAKGSTGDFPFAASIGIGVFQIRLLRDGKYTIQASAYCGKHVESGPVQVNGDDTMNSDISLSIPENVCTE